MQMNDKTKFRAGLVAALGAATFVAIGVSAQTDGSGAPGVSASASPSASPSGGATPTATPTLTPTSTPTVIPSPVATAAPGARQVYSAVLNPTNGSGAAGTATVIVDQGRLGAMVQASGLAPNVMHPMHIHQGNACADFSADLNNDGIVDAVESEAVVGPPIIPLSLSGDLNRSNAQAAANQIYSTAAPDGVVNYINAGPSAFLSSLPAPATTATPTATASPAAGEMAGTASLALSGRVVEIHGIDPTTVLPNTVASDVARKTPQETLGVACGVLVPVTE